MATITQQQWKDWEQHTQRVRASTLVDPTEGAEEKISRISRAKKDYEFFFKTYFPHYCERKAGNPDAGYIDLADFHVKGAYKLISKPKINIAKEWYRSSAKSVHSGMGEPLWLMINEEMRYMVLASDTEDKAKVLISSIQAELEYNQRFINDFGKQLSHGDWSTGSFQTRTGKIFTAIGIGQSPRGLRRGAIRPDYILVDDADTKERCRNPRRVKEAVEWVLEDLRGCFDANDDSRERFVICNNNIAKHTILKGVIEDLKDIIHIKVNALDEYGLPTWPAKTTLQYWTNLQAKLTYRAFEREYMNNPIEDGTIFKEEWMGYKQTLKIEDYDSIVGYGDLSYRKLGDYKAFVIIGRIGKEYHIIKVFCRQTGLDVVAKWLYDVHEVLFKNERSPSYYIEGNFIQDDFVSSFDEEGDQRGWYLPIIADKRSKPDKFSRIEAISPLWERGWVFFNEAEKGSTDMETLKDQFLAFEQGSGAKDDGPDAVEGALHKLNVKAASKTFKPVIGDRKGFLSKFKW